MGSGRHRYLKPAEDVRALRAKLGLSQSQFAARLGVSKRTVIRGERRGLELPYHEYGARGHVWRAWVDLQAEATRAGDVHLQVDAFDQAADRRELGRSTKCHPPAPASADGDTLLGILDKVSPAPTPAPAPKKPKRRSPRKRLRLSRELLRARGGKSGGRPRAKR